MADERHEAVGGDDGGERAEAEQRVGCGAVQDVGEVAAAGEEAVRGREGGALACEVGGAQAGDALLRCFGRGGGGWL